MSTLLLPPFHRSTELVQDASAPTPGTYVVPNEPFLADSALAVEKFLKREVSTPVLDELQPHFDFIAWKSSSRIAPLHAQVVKGRTVVISERPDLHLVWYYKTIFLKPLPHCLLNRGFWERYLCPRDSDSNFQTPVSPRATTANCKAALGYIRTYGYLIKHESDFRVAKAANLLPENTTYSAFQSFIEPFRRISDKHVSPRYHYGQLRLTRLNWAVRLFAPSTRATSWGRRMYFLTLVFQTGQYFEQFGPPLIFLFASLSLILSSVQVVLAARPDSTWTAFRAVSWGFSVAVMILVALLSILAIVFFILRSVFAIKFKGKKEGEADDDENNHDE